MENELGLKAVPITCGKCGYHWKTKSKMDSVCCPNCQRKHMRTKKK